MEVDQNYKPTGRWILTNLAMAVALFAVLFVLGLPLTVLIEKRKLSEKLYIE